MAVAIQVTADLSTLTLEDASGQLRTAQQCDTEDDGPSPPRVDGKLYLMREQGEVQSRDKKGEGSSAGSRSGNHQWQRCNSSGGGPSAIPGQKAGPDHCRRCGKIGQWARDCPMKPQNQAAPVAQVDEEEEMLIMAMVSLIQISPTPRTA